MTGQSGNRAPTRGPGTVYRAGDIRSDASMGNVDNSRRTTISLGAFGVVLGVVLGVAMTLAAGFGVWKLVATDNAATPTPNRAQASDSQATEIRLARGTGVDVEGADAKVTPTDGANGTLDLYLERSNLLYANGTGFSTDRGTA